MSQWFKLPTKRELALALKTLPLKQRRIVLGAAVGLTLGLLLLGIAVNNYFSVIVPASGGSLREGLVGTPNFINPVLAASDADRDLTILIYSGLMRVGENGELIPDLAESYEVSADKLTYSFKLKKGLEWHDGEPLTASDVEFTVEKIQDPLIKSPRRASWDGIKAEVVNDREIRFQLKKPYAAFLEAATTGILPKHIWRNFSNETFSLNQFNTEAIGSGPYEIRAIKKNKDTGIPEFYDLDAFDNFALGKPFISNLRLRFYPNENDLVEAYVRQEIASLSAISASQASELEARGARVLTSPLPRIFGVFFNHNKAPVFLNQEVRQALEAAIDREAIIETVLHGYGTPASGPLPPQTLRVTGDATTTATGKENRLAEARAILENGGWSWNETEKVWEKKAKSGTQTLAFSVATSDVSELKEAAELVAETWRALGAKVDVRVYEIGDLNKDIIRPREYEALLFGQVLGRVPDLYSFWHSSQRPDPGNNIALYTSAPVDKLLEQLRGAENVAAAAELYEKIETAITEDTPAIFLYAPDFLYLMPEKVKNVSFRPINLPSDRFLSIYRWHINTDKVWKIFTK